MKTAAAAAMSNSHEMTTTTTMTNKPTIMTTTKSSKHQATKRAPFRYSRELLLRIREERGKLIDNICPDIFRTHSYCISGSYWEPEKYFNAMLHGERLYEIVNNTTNANTNPSGGLKSSMSTQHVSSLNGMGSHSKYNNHNHQYNQYQQHSNGNRMFFNQQNRRWNRKTNNGIVKN